MMKNACISSHPSCASWILIGLSYNVLMPTQTTPSIALRRATPEDAAAAAPLIYETMGSLGDYLFGHAADKGAIPVLAALFREGGHFLSHQYSVLAEAEGTVVGIAQEIPEAELSKATIQLVRALVNCFGWAAAIRLAWRGFPLAFEGDAEAGEYYVSTLAVAPAYRNRGIGRVLLEDAARRAQELSISVCSLSVMLHNTNAFRFYQRAGYRVDRKVISKLHAPGVEYAGFFRMIKSLPGEPSKTESQD
jgi:ribosomal protein S18 acetylase RimI-like enzyme